MPKSSRQSAANSKQPVCLVTAAPSASKQDEPVETLVSPNAIEASQIEEIIEAKAIGERIRKLRLKRSMGLVELGQKAGLSASFLSQLETGRVIPTLKNLSRIALVFKKDLTYFFEETNQNCFRRSRGADRIRLPIGDKASPYLIAESMSVLIPSRKLIPCIAEFLPNSQNTSFEPRVFRGQEFLYIIDGSIMVRTENERQVLEVGDIAWIDGSSKRQYSCNDHNPSKAMIISCPQ